MSRSYAAIQNERQSELLSPVLALFWRGHMKIQLSASAVILATLATSAHADADHDYPKAATAGFSTVKHNANTSTSGSRAPGGRASPGGKTREQAQLDASQPQRDDIVPPGNAN